ncbi:hypothetical protein D1007_12050 [Hordeum vulgare]|nr:hypothetical protein D1007_12050 [Hordeum vulgare]
MAQQNADKILGKRTPLCSGKVSNPDKVQDSEAAMWVSKKVDKIDKENYLEDSETTPKSMFELLATTTGKSSSNSLCEPN